MADRPFRDGAEGFGGLADAGSATIDPAILAQAADWLVRLQSGGIDAGEEARLARWRALSPAHGAAWQRAEGLLGALGQVPSGLGRGTLLRPQRSRRRRLLGLAAVALPGGWLASRFLPWQPGAADLSTATGERRSFALADGTALVLDSGSAVALDFGATWRRLRLLGGEILVTTGTDARAPSARSFEVDTAHGRLVALGTRFAVRHDDAPGRWRGAAPDGPTTRLAVFEGAVRIRTATGSREAVLGAGEQANFDARTVGPITDAGATAALWERGLLIARNLPLAALVAELDRHYRGLLGCDPAVADLTVSGAFPVTDPAASLAMLEQALPVRIVRTTRYWTTVVARPIRPTRR